MNNNNKKNYDIHERIFEFIILLLLFFSFPSISFAQTTSDWIDNNRDVVKNSQWFTAHQYADCPTTNSGYWPVAVLDCLISDQANGPLPMDTAIVPEPAGQYYKHFFPGDFVPILIGNIGPLPIPPTVDSISAAIQRAVNQNPVSFANVSVDSLYLGLAGGNSGQTVRSVSLMVHPLFERPIANAIGIQTRVANLYKPFIDQATGGNIPMQDAVTLYTAALNACGRQAINNNQSGEGVHISVGTYTAVVQRWETNMSLSVDDCLIHVVHTTSSISPTVNPSVTPFIPSPTLTPTVSPAQGVGMALHVLLHGVGFSGDNANPNGHGNTVPFHAVKQITLSIMDGQGQMIATQTGEITYTIANGDFEHTISFTGVAAGQYLVSVKVPGFLQKQLPGIQTFSSQNTLQVAPVTLVTGDINNDNQVDILDYNLLINCFGKKQQTATCTTPPTQQASGSDLNDDGVIDGQDYNLFLRELSVQRGV